MQILTTDLMARLESLGTDQNRKVYRRHGAGDNLFGVSYTGLKALKKEIKVNHPLALELWATGNHDARILAMMIADPRLADEALLGEWARDLGNYMVADALSAYASQTALARPLMERWTASSEEWIGTVGWNLLAHLALHDRSLPDAYFEPYLVTIERDIHSRKNRVRYAMNNALIAIGIRGDSLRGRALAAAGKIGEVIVDHGQTACQTPDAAAYIHKTYERQQQRARR
jgi:3-methyladenine DNA glycosylase AlkD